MAGVFGGFTGIHTHSFTDFTLSQEARVDDWMLIYTRPLLGRFSFSSLRYYLTVVSCPKTFCFWPLCYLTKQYIFPLTLYGLLCILNGRVNSSDPAEEVHTCMSAFLRLKEDGCEFEASLGCVVW